jgi:hypothetical protein
MSMLRVQTRSIDQYILDHHLHFTLCCIATAIDFKITRSGCDNRKYFPLCATLQVPQNFSIRAVVR